MRCNALAEHPYRHLILFLTFPVLLSRLTCLRRYDVAYQFVVTTLSFSSMQQQFLDLTFLQVDSSESLTRLINEGVVALVLKDESFYQMVSIKLSVMFLQLLQLLKRGQ